MGDGKRPLFPGIVAVLALFGVVGIGSGLSMILIPPGPDRMVRIQRISEGLGKLGVVLAIAAYFAARSRRRAWDQRQTLEASRAKREAAALAADPTGTRTPSDIGPPSAEDAIAWLKKKGYKPMNVKEKAGSRPRCTRCGAPITGSDQPWQKEGYCSEKCRDLPDGP